MKLPHLLIMFALLGPGIYADDDVKRGGKLLFASGRTLESVEIISLGRRTEGRNMKRLTPSSSISVDYNGVEIDIDLATVSRITFVEPKWASSSKGHSAIDDGSVLNLELRSGKSATVELAHWIYADMDRNGDMDRKPGIRCRFLDPLTDAIHEKSFLIGKEEDQVLAVIFDDDHGTHRWSADSDQYFPPSYNFDPFTGSQLRWASPNVRPSAEAAKLEPTWACVSCRQVASEGPGACQHCKGPLFPARTNVAEKGVAFFLEKAGYDVDSAEGRAAVRLSVQWLNPFATAEENQKALQRSIQEVLEK